ncbi:MAG TPA: hypothetical protein VF559_12310 [Caulobacteraceae bacterium]|jgi:hypothetical protein
MEAALQIGGDLLWVIALTVMASASRTGFRTIPQGVGVPMLWDGKHVVALRLPRTPALTLLPAAAFVLGLVFLYMSHGAGTVEFQVIWFGIKATLAPLIALLHLSHVKRAIQTLGAEKRLIP